MRLRKWYRFGNPMSRNIIISENILIHLVPELKKEVDHDQMRSRGEIFYVKPSPFAVLHPQPFTPGIRVWSSRESAPATAVNNVCSPTVSQTRRAAGEGSYPRHGRTSG